MLGKVLEIPLHPPLVIVGEATTGDEVAVVVAPLAAEYLLTGLGQDLESLAEALAVIVERLTVTATLALRRGK